MKNKILRVTAGDNSIRGFFANTTQMVEKAKELHYTSPVAIAALGRALTATSIMGLMLKEDNHKITVRINGGGPLGSLVVVGNSDGNVKGYVANPQVKSTYLRENKLNVGEAVGTDGAITVIKDIGLKDPYVGSYPLTTGEIAEDFASYFLYSEQQPAAVALGILIDVDYTIKASGGFIIQVMPDIPEEVLVRLEEKLQTIEPITVLMDRGMTEDEILNYVLGDLNPKILKEYEVDFICDCHEERLEKALISIGRKDLQEILEEDGGTEMICHFCNKKYYFDKERLKKLLDSM